MTADNAIWLYGSSARGDQDDLSDLDILLVGASGPSTAAIVERVLAGRSASVSQYSWSEIGSMTGYGSLFLHHLRLEGRPLYEDRSCAGRLRGKLDGIGPYTKASRDVTAFQTVLADVRESLPHGDVVMHDLAVLATLVRHASILGCWLIGDPQFGRTTPVERYARARGLCAAREVDGFSELYKYRLYFDKRTEQRDLVPICAQQWLKRADSLVSSLREIAK